MVMFLDPEQRAQRARRRGQFDDVVAIIPAYNAAATVHEVVYRARRKVARCIVVDDGSTDATGTRARRTGAELIVHTSNRGKGAAIRSAFMCLRPTEFAYAVLLDADGQHDPADIGRFVDAARRQNADIVVGSRMANPEGMPWLRRVTNRSMSRLISWLCGTRLSDTQSGYRLLSKRVLDTITPAKNNFEVESEILLKAARHGMTMTEIPIRSIYAADHTSHISPARDTLRFLRLIGGLVLLRLFYRQPAPCGHQPQSR